jgi:type VI secretion system protein VasD
MNNLLVIRFFLSIFLLCFITGCTSVNSKVGGVFGLDTDLQIKFDVQSDINSDEANNPSPLFVRMYELKSEKLFNKAEFIDLYERDEAVLGADFLSKQELRRFKPGEDRVEKFVTSEETRFIALYAEFFRYKDAKFKIIFPVTANNVIRNSVTIRISDNTIELLD